MGASRIPDVALPRLRANSRYRLVLLDHLTARERAAVGELSGDDLYGWLMPAPGSGLPLRSASTDTALLFLSLAEPGPLPGYVRARLGDDLTDIARLVLDRVLEVEHAGRFVSGAEAPPLTTASTDAGSTGRIAALSIAALRYGQELAGLPEPLLAHRLYDYGRTPITPALARRFADAGALAAHLGLGDVGVLPRWIETTRMGAPNVVWRSWQPVRRPHQAEIHYKLYVSPTVEAAHGIGAVVASAIADQRGVLGFKAGIDLANICRADKLVIYFERLDDLQAGAAILAQRLAGRAAQGVPFTAAVTADGLLSWGIDPPPSERPGRSSWRSWVTTRLAEYLIAAGAGDDRAPWQYALERLRTCRIDTTNWIPTDGMWPHALATG